MSRSVTQQICRSWLAGVALFTCALDLRAQGDVDFALRLGRQEVLLGGPMLVADLNADGRTDIVSRESGRADAFNVVLMGPGAVPNDPVAHPLPPLGPGPIAGDIDADGDIDLVFGAELFLNDGAGVFASVDPSAEPILVSGKPADQALLVELSGDAFPDLVLVEVDAGHLAIHLNLGDGSFSGAVASFDLAPSTRAFAEDFDGDGAVDLAASEAGQSRISVIQNLGGDTFGEPEIIASVFRLRLEKLADLDRDGVVDLVVSKRDEDDPLRETLWIRSVGDGTFEDIAPLPDGAGAQIALSLTARADFDGDGKLDLVREAVGEIFDARQIWLQQDGGEFLAAPQILEADELSLPQLGDFDGDGDIDIAFGRRRLDLFVNGRIDPEAASVVVFERQPTDVTFSGRFGIFSAIASGRAMTTADLDRDGSPDVLLADNSSGVLTVVEPARDLEIPPRREHSLTTTRLTSVAVGDADGDGNPDVGLASRDNVFVLLLGGGDGTLDKERSFPTGAQPLLVEANDLDDDGLMDWLLPNGSEDLTVYWGSGDGDLVERADVPVGDLQHDIAVADFTGDGRKDLMVTSDDFVLLLTNLGGRSFSAPERARREGLPGLLWTIGGKQLETGDFDADGRPDLLVGLRSGGGGTENISILLGRGGARFDLLERGSIRLDGSSFLPPTDVDGDGILDTAFVALGSGFPASGLLTLWSGTGFGTFQSAQAFSFGPQLNPGAIDLGAADFDRDGDIDLAAAGEGRLTFFVNATPAVRRFRRGDSDANGAFDMSDAVGVLNFLFNAGASPPCRRAADANDDGEVTIGDPVRVLTFLFSGGRPLPEPFAECGRDATLDRLTCVNFAPCP